MSMRIRVHFHKTNAMRYTGHLDLFKAWERSLRRAKLPLMYSQGFHPQPKINLACALPLGFTSECELVDIILAEEIPVEKIHQQLIPALPPGILIDDIEKVEQPAPALQTQIQSAEYNITMLIDTPGLTDRIQSLLCKEEIPRIRRGKKYDLRPLIEDLSILPDNDKGLACLKIKLAAREGATGRPEEFIASLGYEPNHARYHRTQLIILENQSLQNDLLNKTQEENQ